VNLGSGVILLVRFSTGYRERSIVTPPKNKEWRLGIAKPLLSFRIGLEVILVVVKEIQLNIALSRLVQEVILVHPQIGVVGSGEVPTCLLRVASRDNRLLRTSAS
jgi:hypothetical protein